MSMQMPTDLEGERRPELLAPKSLGQLRVVPLERPGPHHVLKEPGEGVEGREPLLNEGRPPKVKVGLGRGEITLVAGEGPRLEAFDGDCGG